MVISTLIFRILTSIVVPLPMNLDLSIVGMLMSFMFQHKCGKANNHDFFFFFSKSNSILFNKRSGVQP